MADATPAPLRSQIVAAANESFVSGMHLIVFVAAGVTFLAAIGVARFLPARARDVDDATTRSRRWRRCDRRLAPVRPGRRRDPEVDEAILDAALELFAEDGFRGVTIEGVAARAGVGKATIYRRYPTREALLVDAVRSGCA